MINNILALDQPFSLNELQKKGIPAKRSDLKTLVDEQKLNMKKIGRMNIYWKDSAKSKQTTGMDTLVQQLELEIKELKKELMDERQKVRKLSIQDGIDNPWKEVALEMARILSEQKQVPLQEVLEYFNAPFEE
jgi:hypothetical protein